MIAYGKLWCKSAFLREEGVTTHRDGRSPRKLPPQRTRSVQFMKATLSIHGAEREFMKS